MTYLAQLRQDYNAIKQESEANTEYAVMTSMEQTSTIDSDTSSTRNSVRPSHHPGVTGRPKPSLAHEVERQAKQCKLEDNQMVIDVLHKRHAEGEEEISRLLRRLHECTKDVRRLQQQYHDAEQQLEQDTEHIDHLRRQLSEYNAEYAALVNARSAPPSIHSE
ncbi:hypothetical protein DIURU_002309 [Diutina rugosa]|uniref:Uncharacterized protein n=1 Tax=Diutina rugosa TaxID=5481 RepID=A0A642UR27_DIURU|nr:uncharacterized protein DIURU_002309 [Diutina rugosa]KAA8903797.1 hypothetical protein DIURU_002309 [Diutina rugosa]